jgi:repressor LexA
MGFGRELTGERSFTYTVVMIMEKKKQVLRFYETERRMPSFSELATILGVKSKNAVAKTVKRWLEDGFVSQDGLGRLLPGNVFSGVRMLGSVQAGFPTAAEEELADTMTMDEYLIKNREATFMLRVSGDSMEEAGIIEGDMVLVERNVTPKEGDIVIAEVDHAWTMKYFKKDKGEIYLEPANKKYKAIYPKGELKIAAVVKAVIRKY